MRAKARKLRPSFATHDTTGSFIFWLTLKETRFLTQYKYSDLDAITIGTGANICLRPRNNQIGVLNIDNTIGGSIQVEHGIPGNNTVSTSNVSGSTTVSSGNCQF
ncbi:hypothetical protein [Dulcicalothrix desertica]|nr:hypothetical protein [Dulcicalothrix desertica]TWH40700.1 hypothetical protein CAL7102_10051 [Dulcicalothrix desertica PCC 7102]